MVGRAHSWMMHVFKPHCNRQLPIFEMSWYPVKCCYSEDNLLAHIHKDGYVLGIVQNSKDIEHPAICLPILIPGECQLERHCLDMFSMGDGLTKCKDSLEFLMTIYDLVESMFGEIFLLLL
jgi:hypothetical protein